MMLPVLVTLVGALIGNILGYTVFKGVCADMYYGSYSLPTYVTVWNADAFLLTTIVPVIIMILIDHAVLWYRLKLSPLKLLRRDFSGKKQKRAVYLSPKIGIFSRFRLRVIFQNISNYLVLFVGVVFANLLLFFGNAPAVCSGSLSDGDPGEHAGEIPVHTFGSGKCLFRE